MCLVQETKLDHDIYFSFNGYNVLRNDNSRGSGGTALFFKNTIPFRNHRVFNDVFQSNSVDLRIGNRWVNFASCYFPPACSVNLDLFKTFLKNYDGSIIGGDFNCRHHSYGDFSDNVYGILLFNAMAGMNGTVLNPPCPTCYHNHDGSYIDKFIININKIYN